MGFLDSLLSGLSTAPGFRPLELPTPDIAVPSDIPRALVDVAAGRRTPMSLLTETLVKTGYNAVEEFTGGGSHAAALAARALAEARQDWESWLEGPPDYGLICIEGAPGTGKTTCAADLAWRYFAPAGKRIYWIGVPGELLPPGDREIPIHKLNQLGRALKKAAERGENPKKLIAQAIKPDSVIVIDDCGSYISSGSSDKPENIAIRQILDVRRHLRLIVVPTFQSFAGVDIALIRAADAHIIKPNMTRNDRPEVMRMLSEAWDWWEQWQARQQGEGLTREEIKERILLRAFVRCPEVGYAGLWRHERPEFFSTKFSSNVGFYQRQGLDESDMVEGDFTEVDE